MTDIREVDWRICSVDFGGCGEVHPWRVDVPKQFFLCYLCRVKSAVKRATAAATAGQGAGFGHQGGKR